jgi:glutamate-5-semialdehyde dehydrogenase
MNAVEELARRARQAARALATADREVKDAALLAIADAIEARAAEILGANAIDVEAARNRGDSESLIDRLTLSESRIRDIANGARQVAGLDDPVGEVIRSSITSDGLRLQQVRVPFGVVGMIYEARPNVTVDAAAICLKSGNAVLLRGSSSTAATNALLASIMREALVSVGIPENAAILVPADDRETVRQLLHARGLVDLVIPRGGAALIDMVIREARVPVIETGVGNCHVFIDASADLTKAIPIVVNSKVSRPSVCNAAETLLVHADVATTHLPPILAALVQAGVRIHGDLQVQAMAADSGIPVEPATEADWVTEYGSLDLAVAVVADLDGAIEHIRTHGSGHTEAILTEDERSVQRFIGGCDSAAVVVNASTRFTDGEKFGFGAEIGISTQKLHARGPMALPEMTTSTWIVRGDGQVRA